MRKFTLLILAVMAGMGTASATDYIVAGDQVIANGKNWSNSDATNKMTETSISGVYYLKVSGAKMIANTEYGFKIVESGKWTNENCTQFASESAGNYEIKVTYNSDDTAYDIHYFLNTNTKKCDVFATPMLRSNFLNNGSGNWNWAYDASADFVQDDTFNWHYDIAASAISADINYFSVFTKLNSREFYPTTSTEISWANDYAGEFAYSRSNKSWSFSKPSFDYEKIRFSLEYNPTTGTFIVTPNAFISKTVSGENEYATLGAPVALDLSNLGDVQAYTLTADAATGKITKTAKSDALAANEGVVLHNAKGSDVTLSIPVAASATASASNDLKAFTGGSAKLAQVSETGYTNYILSKEADGVGFYKVNIAGNSMGANTAYLQVKDAANGARTAFFFDNDATGINAIESAQQKGSVYNLNGQLVAQPTKGLYIVNGKKVIVK